MNIALIEDSPGMQEAFARLLNAMPGHRLAGVFGSSEEAMASLKPGAADLLVVDLELPGANGVDFIRWLQGSGLGIPAVVWTVHEGREAVYAALKAGAIGYLDKGAKAHELQTALEGIAQGGSPMSPRIARRLIDDLLNPSAPTPLAEDISLRERAVLRAVASGKTHKQIGADLGISPLTVRSHLQHLYRKLHVTGRAEALQRARNLGLIIGH